ncbi:MAG: hypothetical protein RLZZ401_164 [Pseudomonadota bacterium]
MTVHSKATGLRLLVLGATGAVGAQVLARALQANQVAQVVAPTRRALPAHAKLLNPVVDFEALDTQASWWQVDCVVCALGTTLRAAGSQQAFARVDRDLVIQTATLARQHGARALTLNSSLGASLSGNFYLQTKAQAEAGVAALGFDSYTIVRPSLIDAARNPPRLGEQIGVATSRLLGRWVPARYRMVTADQVAQALLDAALKGLPGRHVVASEALHR